MKRYGKQLGKEDVAGSLHSLVDTMHEDLHREVDWKGDGVEMGRNKAEMFDVFKIKNKGLKNAAYQ